ncbi:MAG: radical SAM protein [Alphaproteobacteria bacterium]|nr:radical SAM protein [Alphaproteobacteria bacterium]
MADSISLETPPAGSGQANAKFSDPEVTLDGSRRAKVALRGLETLWVNTGTLCNIACANCYIESSPTNDRLAYFRRDDLAGYLDEIARDRLPTREIGFTGGEPFMNPDITAMLEDVLGRGLHALVLTNAMKPMHHKKAALLDLRRRFGDLLVLRVSLDHYTARRHEEERGPSTWAPTLDGIRWLAENGFDPRVAGRTIWEEDEATLRAGYGRMFESLGIGIDCDDRDRLVLFPEMTGNPDVPEITEQCWDILGVAPEDIMCATSRMVVRRKDATGPAVLACTLIPYDRRFELGATLAAAAGPVSLNHPHCAKFCVLGGGSCAGG